MSIHFSYTSVPDKSSNLWDKLNNISNISSLLDVIFDDYLIQYYQDPPPGRKDFLEKIMDEIYFKINELK